MDQAASLKKFNIAMASNFMYALILAQATPILIQATNLWERKMLSSGF
jgi:hypothetical protein